MTERTGSKPPRSSSLQLNTDLRLHPQRLSLGKAELLTDAITLPFTDINSRLAYYVLGATASEKRQLRSKMKNYLGRLNANPHIPLKFRLKVLIRFEQELDLFDAEMTAAVLNAHKVGVALVQEAARHEPVYFLTLVDMIANAIELTIKLLRIDLQHYRPASIIVTRQFFELAKLGLEVSASLQSDGGLSQDENSKIARLHQAICNHEFLRCIDFFSHEQTQQHMIWRELQYHIKAIQVFFYRHGQAFAHDTDRADKGISMLINLNRPDEQARIIQQKNRPPTAPFDCMIMPLDTFITRLAKGLRSVRQVLDNHHSQHKALHTEDALSSTMIGGKAILLAMKTEKRHRPRQTQCTIKVHLNEHLAQSMIAAFSMQQESARSSPDDPSKDTPKTWNIVDINTHGACLERLHIQAQSGGFNDGRPNLLANLLANLLGKMVGLDWLFGDSGEQRMGALFPDTTPPALAFIRWVKEHKTGEQRIGIAFFHQHALPDQSAKPFQLAKAVILGGSKDLQEKRTWPILIRSKNTSCCAIFPDSKIYKNMSFLLLQDQHNQHHTVQRVITTAANYTRCDIIPAKGS